MDTNPPHTVETIRDCFDRNGGDLKKVAADLNISYEKLVAAAVPERPAPPPRRTPPAIVGRIELKRFIVAIRHRDNPEWPKDAEGKINSARIKYDAGTHEMCQGADGNWIILYLIPRRTPTKPRRYFTNEIR